MSTALTAAKIGRVDSGLGLTRDRRAMSLIDNERVKLAANALNTLATAMVAVGVLAPVAAVLYGLSATPITRPLWLVVLSAVVWISVGGVLHPAGQLFLGRLRT